MTEFDDQQHRFAHVPEVFGDRHRCPWREAAHHWAFVAGRNDRDHGGAIFAQRVVEKFPHFATPLADERDDDCVDRRRPGQHGEKRGLADARAREHAHALSDAERGEEIDHTHAGAERRANATAPQRWRRRSVKRNGPGPNRELARAVDRAPERVDDASLPGWVRRQRQGLGAKSACADRRVAAGVERLESGRDVVDPDHFADLNPIADIDADALAELEKARQASHAIMGHRDLDDGTAHPRQWKIAQSPGDSLFEALKRRESAGTSVGHAEDPRVLIASCSDDSDCEASAATPSNARVTSISRVISRTGSTFELSTAP